MATHDDVAHNWAHQTGRACNGFSMFYDGDTIYSWGRHFPMARFTHDASGKAIILCTTRRYSVSTGTHLTIVSRSLPTATPHIFVDDCTAQGKAAHKANYRQLLKSRDHALDKASRARINKPYYLSNSEALRKQANDYTKLFRLGFRKVERPADLEAWLQAHAEKERLRNLERDRQDKVKLREWCAGGTAYPPHTRIPYVRVHDGEVQTSWGARVPLKAAVALFKLASKCAARGEGFDPAKRHMVGQYPLDRISIDGTIRVSCHSIPLAMQRIAAKTINLV